LPRANQALAIQRRVMALFCNGSPPIALAYWPHTGDRTEMLKLALFFLVISLIAALFGFTGISAATADIAKILFFIAIVIFLVLLVAGLMAGSALF
jgi:uncharacterized membrane protein YtjA (UPF0391 family)